MDPVCCVLIRIVFRYARYPQTILDIIAAALDWVFHCSIW